MDKQLHNTSTPSGDSTNKPVINGTKPLLDDLEAAKSTASAVTNGISSITVLN